MPVNKATLAVFFTVFGLPIIIVFLAIQVYIIARFLWRGLIYSVDEYIYYLNAVFKPNTAVLLKFLKKTWNK